MVTHKASVVPSNGGRDTPFKAVCSCGWDQQSTRTASLADADRQDHLHAVETGLWEHTMSHGNGTRCTDTCAWKRGD